MRHCIGTCAKRPEYKESESNNSRKSNRGLHAYDTSVLATTTRHSVAQIAIRLSNQSRVDWQASFASGNTRTSPLKPSAESQLEASENWGCIERFCCCLPPGSATIRTAALPAAPPLTIRECSNSLPGKTRTMEIKQSLQSSDCQKVLTKYRNNASCRGHVCPSVI